VRRRPRNTVLVVVEPVVRRDSHVRDRRGVVRELRDLVGEIRVRDKIIESLLNRQRHVEVCSCHAWARRIPLWPIDARRLVRRAEVLPG
jgi:hypothetical protein